MNKSNLILHCGARHITRDALSNIACPAATETWHPIPHIRMVNEIERALAGSGMAIVNEAFGVTEDNQRMFGLLQVGRTGQVDATDHAYVVGIRGATDKSLAHGLAVGSSVFVCDNLAFSSEIVFSRKCTINVERDLPIIVDTAIGQLGQRWNSQETRIAAYKQKEIGMRDADHLLAEMAGEVFPWQKFAEIRSEFRSPRHNEFGKDNLWALFNSVTEYLKPRAESKASGLWTMPARTSRLHKVCDQFAGLTIDTTAEATPVEDEAALVVNN
jgi:Domain of unknown function (DUF932)